ncbi:MAG: hypothetical protein ACI97A_001578 [Planctomycetota bacterium]|jgi:hypothetical protein
MIRRQSEGITLIELMTAMTIFAMIGVFLFTLVQDSLGIYRKSRSSGEIYDKFDQASQFLSDDLTCVAIGDPEGQGIKLQFLQSRDRAYVPPVGVTLTRESRNAKTRAPGDPRSFLMRFVRSFPGGEMNDTVGRFAGTYAGAEKSIDGEADLVESRHARIMKRQLEDDSAKESDDEQEPGLLPPGNHMEVMYFCESSPNDKAGTFTLYRAFRSPVGGADSFFNDATLKKMTPEWIEKHAKPVVSGLIYFGAVLWGQNTEKWDTERVLNGEGEGSRTSTGMAESWWDSRRARYENFSLHVGANSALYYEDDVFPSRVQFRMTFVQDGKASADAHLLGNIKGNSRYVNIDNPSIFDGGGGTKPPTHIMIGREWIEVSSASGRRLTVVRGSRKTALAKHDSGSDVQVGRQFKLTVEVPAFRTSFGTQGSK